jgi:PIN domain nuclease of toxin-antitoxin system
MPMLNLDTHVLVYALTGDLTRREIELLSRSPWGIAAIVFWELSKLAQLGRLTLDMADADVQATLSSVHVWPLDLRTARTSTRLDFKGDPADELIAATSVVHQVPLLTRDRRIRRSRMVPLA